MSQQLPIKSTRANYAIGIDPDIEKSGLAVWSRARQRHTYVEAVPFWLLLEKINLVQVGQATFYVDAGWLNGGYFHGLPPDFDTWHQNSRQAYLIKRGIDVGRNFGVGQVIVAYLRAYGHQVKEVRPTTEKWNKADLQRYSGWTRRTNQDARDAAKLCFQR